MNSRIIAALILAAGAMLSPGNAQSKTIPDASAVPDAPVASSAPVAARSVPKTTGPNQAVYTAQLPTVEELTHAASAKGTTVLRIEQTASEITTTYQLRNGQTHVVAYRLLPTAAQTWSNSAPLIVTTPPPPAVVYMPRSRVVYYDSYGWYDPWFWSPRLSFHFSLGHAHRWHHSAYSHRRHYGHGAFHHRGFSHRSHFRHR